MTIKKYFFLFINFGLIQFAYGQTDVETEIVSFEDYMQMVSSYHPVVIQAKLVIAEAEGNRLSARGALDAKVETAFDQKSFDNKNYYKNLSSAVKIPTWWGADIKAGYEQSSGDFLDNSDFLPERGIWSLGISIPLWSGLKIDQRRAMIKQADIWNNISLLESRLLLNDLYYDAADVYIQWTTAYQQNLVAEEGLALAENRLTFTKQSFEFGDYPAIDTLEATLTVQKRAADLIKSEQQLQKVRLQLENFLWTENYIPLVLSSSAIPEIDINNQWFDEVQESQPELTVLIANHPILLSYDLDISRIDIDQQLVREDLKPDIRLNYTPIVGTTNNKLFDTPNIDDYKFQIQFNYPIQQRKARGKLQALESKSAILETKLNIKQQNLLTKINTFYINGLKQATQVSNYRNLIQNQQRLLDAENRKLSIGESSIFLINSREQKYLEGRSQLIQEINKLLFNRLNYLYTTGMPLWEM